MYMCMCAHVCTYCVCVYTRMHAYNDIIYYFYKLHCKHLQTVEILHFNQDDIAVNALCKSYFLHNFDKSKNILLKEKERLFFFFAKVRAWAGGGSFQP